MREHADPGRNDFGELLARNDGDDPGHLPRDAWVDPGDLRVGVRRAQEHHVRHPRQLHVADIETSPLHQPIEIGTRYRLPDVGIRPIEHGKSLGIGPYLRHDERPFRALAVVSTASTMAW